MVAKLFGIVAYLQEHEGVRLQVVAERICAPTIRKKSARDGVPGYRGVADDSGDVFQRAYVGVSAVKLTSSSSPGLA